MKFISIITPTYNRANKLHRVFNSIKNQTLKKVNGKYIFEWIVIDDGSKDNTKEIIEKWKREVDWTIIYKYQENRGKPWAVIEGLKYAKGELTLLADSDDEFLPETIETFYNIWNNFTDEEKEKCGGIGALYMDQFGNPIGVNYPEENKILPTIETVFKWRNIVKGDTMAILKTENLKKAFKIPDEAKHLKFIPETFFWDKIVFELKPYSYYINKRLGIVYRNEEDNISKNIRKKYPEGFLFESKWFINNYYFLLLKEPKQYIKHIIKYIIFSLELKIPISQMFNKLSNNYARILFTIFFIPAVIIRNKYLNGKL